MLTVIDNCVGMKNILSCTQCIRMKHSEFDIKLIILRKGIWCCANFNTKSDWHSMPISNAKGFQQSFQFLFNSKNILPSQSSQYQIIKKYQTPKEPKIVGHDRFIDLANEQIIYSFWQTNRISPENLDKDKIFCTLLWSIL